MVDGQLVLAWGTIVEQNVDAVRLGQTMAGVVSIGVVKHIRKTLKQCEEDGSCVTVLRQLASR